MSARRVEHGTPEGYARGCTVHEKCPALTVHGLTCFTAHVRFESGERRYMQARARDPRAAAIAKRLGFIPEFAPDLAAAERELAVDAEFAAKPADYKYRMSRRQEDRVVERALAAPTPAPAPAAPADETPTTPPQQDPIREDTPMTTPAEKAKKPAVSPAEAAAAARERKAVKDRAQAIATPEGRAKVRAWAKRNGHQIGEKGRIPADIVYAFVDAGGKDYPTDPITTVTPDAAAPATIVSIPLTDAEYSEALAGARERAGAPEVKLVGDLDDYFPTSTPDTGSAVTEPERPEWSTVVLTLELERARATGVRLEQELAHTEEQLDQARRALDLALIKWGTATAELRLLDTTAEDLIARRDRYIRGLENTCAALNDAHNSDRARIAWLEAALAASEAARTRRSIFNRR